ncbi:MAG: hypothetical protein VCB99_01725, partial [Myxococcota bacterium]
APVPIKDINDVPLSSTKYALAVGSGDAAVEITVRPRVGDATGLDWDVSLRSTQDILSANLGFILPTGASASGGDMKLVDCPTVNEVDPAGLGAFSCDSYPALDDANLDTNVSKSGSSQQTYTGSSDSPRGDDDTLYVHFVGNTANGGGQYVLVHVDTGSVEERLGTLRLTGSYAGEAPVVTLEGAHLFGVDVFQTVGGSLGAGDALLTGTGSSGEDYDADGVMNDWDNCRYAWNPDNADGGGHGTVIENDRGDACECGDGDGDGVVGTQTDGMVTVSPDPDVPELQRILAGDDGVLNADEKTARCSVNGDTACDILDLVILQAAIAPGGSFSDVVPVCLRAISSEVPSDD